MRYYSTSDASHTVPLEHAVLHGLAPGGGLYMPQTIAPLPEAFLRNLAAMSLPEIGYAVANYALQGDVEANALHDIVTETLSFPIPLVEIAPGRYVLELFHGPTMCFKDIGARFMGRLLRYFHDRHYGWSDIHVLVATSGDTGAAVASGLLDVPGVRLTVLYPQEQISYAQEAQFASLGRNVTALEVKGNYDDCKRLVAEALLDGELTRELHLTTATTVNIARLLPQTFYYFYAYAQLLAAGADTPQIVFSVPSANLGNLASGLLAQRMGLPVKRFVSVENRNNIFYNYIRTGRFTPRDSVYSIAPALDAGNPTNFPRITALTGSHEQTCRDVHAYCFDDSDIAQTMRQVYARHDYQFDPHSAIAWRGLEADLGDGETGVSLATAHPGKFRTIVEDIMNREIPLPASLARSLSAPRRVTTITNGFNAFRRYLLSQAQ